MNVTIDLQHFSSHPVPMKVVMTHPRARRGFDHPASADRPQAIHFGLSSFARCAVRCFSQSTRFLFAIPDFQHQQPFSGPTRHLYKDNGRPGYQDGHQKHKQFQASCKAEFESVCVYIEESRASSGAMSSSTTSVTSTSPPNPPAEKDVQQKTADEEPFNPRSLKFITVMLGMYMSVFLVALVRPHPEHLPCLT